VQIGEFLLKAQPWLNEGPERGETPQGIEAEVRRMTDDELRTLQQLALQHQTNQEAGSNGTRKPRPTRARRGRTRA
jgi:hypothetical protein